MDSITKIQEYFADIQTTKEHNGYYYSVGEALTVVILGSLCGLRNVSQINQWSEEQRAKDFLLKHFSIQRLSDTSGDRRRGDSAAVFDEGNAAFDGKAGGADMSVSGDSAQSREQGRDVSSQP